LLLAPPTVLLICSQSKVLVLLLFLPKSDLTDLLEMFDIRDFLVDLIAFPGVLVSVGCRSSFSLGRGDVIILT